MTADADHPIDAVTAHLIKTKAAWLARRSAIPGAVREEIEQDLILELLRRWPDFDPARSERSAFIHAILHHAVADLVRSRLTGKRNDRWTTSLESLPPGDPTLGQTDPGRDQADLVSDVQRLLRTLPLELRAVAERLQTATPTETARQLGICRGTVYRRMSEIREHFERGDLHRYLSTSWDSPRAAGVVT